MKLELAKKKEEINEEKERKREKDATNKNEEGESLEASCCVCQLLFERWLSSAKWL